MINFLKHAKDRIFKGYSERDTWNLDNHLARIIRDATADLAKTHHGYPYGLTDDLWTQTLEEISQGFASYLDLQDEHGDINYAGNWVPPSKKKVDKLQMQYNKGMRLFKKYFNHLWD